MPGLFNDALDDPPLTDWQRGFAGGMVSAAPPDEIPVNAAALLQNVDLYEGRAVTRRGAEQWAAAPVADFVCQGQKWFETPALRLLVQASSGLLWKWDGTTWTQIAGYAAADTERRVAIEQLVNKLYIADGSGHLFQWDGTTLTDLGTGGGTQPPLGRILCQHTQRLFMAGIAAEPDAVYCSDFLTGSTWNIASQAFRVGAGDGDPITGLCAWDKFTLLVFKQRSIWAVNADPQFPVSAWSIERISGSIGCVGERTITPALQDIYFLSHSGVRSIRRILAGETSATSEAISSPIQDRFDEINWNAADMSAAVFFRDRWMLSVPIGTSSRPDTMFVLDARRGVWAGVWTGWNAQAWSVTSDSGGLRLVFGRRDGSVWRWRDYVANSLETDFDFTDPAQPYVTAIDSRGMIFEDAENPKAPFRVEVEFFNSRAPTVQISQSQDRGSPVLLAPSISSRLAVLELPFTLPAILPADGLKRWGRGTQHLPTAKVMQILLRSGTDKLAVRGVVANAFRETVDIEP